MNKVDNLNQASFNSRTPKGCDGSVFGSVFGRGTVSIHAPLKGATFPFILELLAFWFQFTHP